MEKPLIAITLGDPAGIGPETIAGAWPSARVHDACRPVVIGHPEIVRRAVRLLALPIEVAVVEKLDQVSASPSVMPCLRCGSDEALHVAPATIDGRAGQAAYDALMLATDLALAGEIDAIVTAPLHKAALWQAGHRYPGHTELLAERCGARDFAMMLYMGPGEGIAGAAGLGVVHVTLHIALRDVFNRLTLQTVYEKIRLADGILRRIKGSPPSIGVCALNPHAGEEGIFGDEERRIIRPAVEQARAEGLHVSGPHPTDTLMVRARGGEFDAIVAMYHDQGHIALKLLGWRRAVNVTLGLPIVRTSVAHGTAFDIAWQGKADASSMIEAIAVAARLSGGAKPTDKATPRSVP